MEKETNKRGGGRPAREDKDKLRRHIIRIPPNIDDLIIQQQQARKMPFSDVCAALINERFDIEGTKIVGYAQAGEPAESEVDGGFISCNVIPSGEEYGYVHILGDSMDKVITPGSYAHLRLNEMPSIGKYVGATIDTGAGPQPIFKRYSIYHNRVVLECESNDPSHKNIIITDEPIREKEKFIGVKGKSISFLGVWTGAVITPIKRK